MQSWKNYQTDIKLKKYLRRIILVVVAVFAVVIALLITKFTLWLHQPVTNDTTMQGFTPYLPKSQQVNILVAGQDTQDQRVCFLLVAALDRGGKNLRVLQISTKQSLNTRQGEFKIRNLINAGNALNPPQGISFLVDSVSRFLAVPIDAQLVMNDYCPEEFQVFEVIKKIHRSWQYPLFSLTAFRHRNYVLGQITTNMSRYQLWRVIMESRGVREDKIDLTNLDMFEGEVEYELLDQKVVEVFRDREVENEGLQVIVMNGTGVSGLASIGARYISNLGGRVLAIENYTQSDEVDTTMLSLYRKSGLERSLIRVKQIFGTSEIRSLEDKDARADLNIVIGLDWNR